MSKKSEKQKKIDHKERALLIAADRSHLSEEESKQLDGYVDSLWEKVGEMMEGDEGYRSRDHFDFKMSTWVQGMCIETNPDKRILVLAAAVLVERRFYTVMRLAMREN